MSLPLPERPTFTEVGGAYPTAQVDEWVDETIRGIAFLQERVQALEDERDAVDATRASRILVAAQRTADNLIDEAREEARGIVAKAHVDIGTLRGEILHLTEARDRLLGILREQIPPLLGPLTEINTSTQALSEQLPRALAALNEVQEQPDDNAATDTIIGLLGGDQ